MSAQIDISRVRLCYRMIVGRCVHHILLSRSGNYRAFMARAKIRWSIEMANCINVPEGLRTFAVISKDQPHLNARTFGHDFDIWEDGMEVMDPRLDMALEKLFRRMANSM